MLHTFYMYIMHIQLIFMNVNNSKDKLLSTQNYSSCILKVKDVNY